MEYKLIGSGRTSDVFDYNENVLKLYKEYIDERWVEREYYFSKFAYENKIITPEPKSIVNEQNRKGIIFQKINGQSLLKSIVDNPLKIKQFIKKSVELQYGIHNVILRNAKYTFKNYLKYSVENNVQIDEADKILIQEYINSLPEGNSLCHGDFHPDNILFDNEDYYVIDWMTGMQGNIAADVARSEMIIKNAEIPGNIPNIIKKIIQISQNKLSQMYIKEYCKISKLEKKEIEIWKLPLYVARLNENNNKEEENRLLKFIKKEIKKQKASA